MLSMHADREIGGGRLAKVKQILDGRLPGAWVLTLTRQNQGGGRLLQSGRLPGTPRYIVLHVMILQCLAVQSLYLSTIHWLKSN